MTDQALYYALSTIAQCAAALAALIGFLGLWRLDRLREEEQRIERGQGHPPAAYMNTEDTNRWRGQLDEVCGQQQQLMSVLVIFLLGTLAVLILAIGLIPFAEALSTWVWPMRGLILVFSLWLGGAPAYVMLQAAGGVPVWQQVWSRVRHWHGPVLVAARLRDRWRHQPRNSPP